MCVRTHISIGCHLLCACARTYRYFWGGRGQPGWCDRWAGVATEAVGWTASRPAEPRADRMGSRADRTDPARRPDGPASRLAGPIGCVRTHTSCDCLELCACARTYR